MKGESSELDLFVETAVGAILEPEGSLCNSDGHFSELEGYREQIHGTLS